MAGRQAGFGEIECPDGTEVFEFHAPRVACGRVLWNRMTAKAGQSKNGFDGFNSRRCGANRNEVIMCDCSLEHVASHPALNADKLQSAAIRGGHGTIDRKE